MVAVEEHGGHDRAVLPIAVDVRVHAGDLQHLHVLDAGIPERLRHRLRGATHLLGGKARRRHAGDAAQGHQGFPPVIEPCVRSPSAFRTMPSVVAMLRLPPALSIRRRWCGTSILVVNAPGPIQSGGRAATARPGERETRAG